MRASLSAYSPHYCWGAAVAGAAFALGSTLYNAFSQNQNNKRQEAWAREQFDYNKQLNQTIMDREDNAYQRAVLDAQRAGLSPLTVAGTGGAGAGGTVSQSNIAMNTQAPQLEANTFMDAMRSLENEHMQQRQLKASAESQEDQQEFEAMQQAAAYDAQDKMLDKQLEATRSIEDKKLAEQEAGRVQNLKIFNATQRNIYESKNEDERVAACTEAKKAASAIGVKNFEPFTDWAEYKQALKARTAGAQARASDSWAMTAGYDETTVNTGSSSVSSDGSMSAGVKSPGVSSGANFGASSTDAGSSSQTHHSSAVQMMQQAEAEYWNKTGYPVYVGSYHHTDVH